MTRYSESAIARIADHALNVAAREIQDELGIDSGDVAGVFFTGENYTEVLRRFVDYIKLEISFKESE